MGHRDELAGKKFGRWSVVSLCDVNARGEIYWNCVCECGATRAVKANSLRSERSTSCGCYHRDERTTHGFTGTPTFRTWETMRQRCFNENSPDYRRYGGRGITVCKRWNESFEAFLEDMGVRPNGMTLDRKDVNGNYELRNCRWATASRQQRNRADRALLHFDGKTLCLADWSDETKIPAKIIAWRLKNGWAIEKALRDAIVQGRGKKAK